MPMNTDDQCKKIANCFEFMPDSNGKNNQNELTNLFLKHKISDTVTFFGGSFNPFHQGHRACLDLCPEKNILVVPDRNPQKEYNDSKILYEDFLALSESLKETRYSLYPGFLIKSEGNPTSSWLPNVKIAEKNFLMGDDSYMNLLNWKNPEIILAALTKLYVVPRNFEKGDYLIQEIQILKYNPKLIIHYLDVHPYMNLSSTKIRTEKI